MNCSLNNLYKLVGVSKQAFHQYHIRARRFAEQISLLEVLVREVREVHGGCGLETMYHQLQPDFIGRDRFIAMFQGLGYGLKTRRKVPKTTTRGSFRAKNLIEGMVVWAPDQVWQSDITYFEVKGRFYFLTFIIDVYTKRIVGYGAYDHLRASANEAVLKQAIKLRGTSLKPGLIHHSDQGVQYTSMRYRKLLNTIKASISMAACAQDNPYAERINGTIKNDYLRYKHITSFKKLRQALKAAVNHYNTTRPHKHLGRMTPIAFEEAIKMKPTQTMPITLIYAKDGPDFRYKIKAIDPEQPFPKLPFCPIQNNTLFYN